MFICRTIINKKNYDLFRQLRYYFSKTGLDV
jgi:hypothetical protein